MISTARPTAACLQAAFEPLCRLMKDILGDKVEKVRRGDDLLINRTRAIGSERGSMPVVRTGIDRDDERTPWASSALCR